MLGCKQLSKRDPPPGAKQPQFALEGPTLTARSHNISSRCAPHCVSKVLVPPSHSAHIHHVHVSLILVHKGAAQGLGTGSP